MGTPEFAAPCLRMLIAEGYEIAAAVTQPDRPKGRGGKTVAPVIKDVALGAGLRVLQPERPSDIYGELSELHFDLCVTAAYGCILKKRFLKMPALGTVNVHASLLPRYRGASPIHAALLNGDGVAGVTTMLTVSEVDAGPILMSASVEVSRDMYFMDLHDRLAALGAEALKKTIPAYVSGVLRPTPQNDCEATYAPIIKKSDGELDFRMCADRLVNVVRAYGAWPGAVTRLNGKNVRIIKAKAGDTAPVGGDPSPGDVVGVGRDALSFLCGDGRLLNVTRLQFENGREMDISECWHNLRK